MTAIMKDQYQWLCVSIGGPCYRYDCRKIKQKHRKKRLYNEISAIFVCSFLCWAELCVSNGVVLCVQVHLVERTTGGKIRIIAFV